MPIKVGEKIQARTSGHPLVNGEEVLAAAAVQPPGAALYNSYRTRNGRRSIGAGVVGMAVSKLSKGHSGAAASIPRKMGALILTPTRVLFMSFAKISGRPKKLLAEWARESVSFTYDDSNEYPELLMTFADGSGAVIYAEGAGGLDLFAPYSGA